MPDSRFVHEVLQVPGHDGRNFNKLVRQVVGEVDVVSHTAGHSRDIREEAIHAVFVPVMLRRTKQKAPKYSDEDSTQYYAKILQMAYLLSDARSTS